MAKHLKAFFKVITFLVVVGCPPLVWAQAPITEIPVLKDVKVQTVVTQESTTGMYTYTYTISNPASNTGQIWSIDLDIIKPSGGMDLPWEGLVSGTRFRDFLVPTILAELSKNNIIIVPVGMDSPEFWMGGLAADGMAGWGSADAPYRISPGNTLDGFKVTSFGLPGIRQIRMDPRYEAFPEVGDEEAAKEFHETVEAIASKTKTLGPTTPPANFVALDFVNYLIDLKHRAGTLGWITNPGVQDSLDVKLDQVAKKLQAGDTKTAANVLNAFLNEVDAQGCPKYEGCPAGKHLLPEAWALLKFNAEYLLSRL